MKTVLQAGALLACLFGGSAWLLAPAQGGGQAYVLVTGERAGPGSAVVPLVDLRAGKPAHLGQLVPVAAQSGVFQLRGGDGLEPERLLLLDVTPSEVWSLASEKDRAGLQAGSARVAARFGEVARAFAAALAHDPAVARAMRLSLASIPSDDVERGALRRVEAGFAAAFAPERSAVAHALASQAGAAALASFRGAFDWIWSTSSGEEQGRPDAISGLAADPELREAAARTLDRFVQDGEALRAAALLASRLAERLAADPVVRSRVSAALSEPELQAAAEAARRDTLALVREGLTKLLRIGDEPAINPLAAAVANSVLRGGPRRIAVALAPGNLGYPAMGDLLVATPDRSRP